MKIKIYRIIDNYTVCENSLWLYKTRFSFRLEIEPQLNNRDGIPQNVSTLENAVQYVFDEGDLLRYRFKIYEA